MDYSTRLTPGLAIFYSGEAAHSAGGHKVAMAIKIHQIGNYIVKNYVLETPAGLIAIDTGYPGGFAKFKARFEQKFPLADLQYIFLTHHHDDHCGFLNELTDATTATVILHPLALQYMATGRNNQPPGGGYSSFLGSLFGRLKKDFSFPPVRIPDGRARMVAAEEEQVFEDAGLPLKILFLPGHTDDSIGLFLPETNLLFCGDAAMNAVISTARHTIWIDDAAQFGRSWDRMLALEPKILCPSHGNPFPATDLLKYRHYLDGKKLIHLK
jgi:glyoxylase-like metal-dependent hydrolase (beta-lactamase superfamily II)